MTLASWEAKGWVRKARTHKQEILELLDNAECDLMDARREFPPEWRFGLAFTAALNLCAIYLHASGYQADNESHFRAIHALPLILGEDRKADTDYLETCFMLHNQKKSDPSASITSQQASELVYFVEEFYLQTCEWLRSSDSGLIVNSDFFPACADVREEGLVL